MKVGLGQSSGEIRRVAPIRRIERDRLLEGRKTTSFQDVRYEGRKREGERRGGWKRGKEKKIRKKEGERAGEPRRKEQGTGDGSQKMGKAERALRQSSNKIPKINIKDTVRVQRRKGGYYGRRRGAMRKDGRRRRTRVEGGDAAIGREE